VGWVARPDSDIWGGRMAVVEHGDSCWPTTERIMGLGQPLLDVVVGLPMEELEKYELKPGTYTIAGEQHASLFDRLLTDFGEAKVVAGGCAMNTMRVAQWVSGQAGFTSFFGSVGKDEYAKILKRCCAEANVKVELQVTDLATGVCAVLVNGSERALCTRLDASKASFMDKLDTPELTTLIDDAGYLYVAAFALVCTDGLAGVEKLFKKARASNTVIAVNLAAPFVVESCAGDLWKMIEMADIVFGNETEWAALAKSRNSSEDLASAAQSVSSLPKSFMYERLAIVTQGPNHTIVAQGGRTRTFPVPVLEQVEDTNGAGDAFVGGFLTKLAQGKDLQTCVDTAHLASRKILEQCGCHVPEIPFPNTSMR